MAQHEFELVWLSMKLLRLPHPRYFSFKGRREFPLALWERVRVRV